jgi:hypothetical protein
MKTSCLVGNVTELSDKFKHLLINPTIDVLATETSSMNSCYHLYFEKFNNRSYQTCIIIYGENFSRYYRFDGEEGKVITPGSAYSMISYLPDNLREEDDSPLNNECYIFRQFLLLHTICIARNIRVTVIEGDTKYSGSEFVRKMQAKFGPPAITDVREGITLYGYHNGHTEYLTRYRDKDKLLVVLGDSWVVADSKDNTDGYWHAGYIHKSFGNLVAEHFDSDLVVCGSPGNSNANAVINFLVWFLYNRDRISQYKDVRIIFSKTAIDRDFTVKWNIGWWRKEKTLSRFVLQNNDKLIRDCMTAIETFNAICLKFNLPVYYMFNHSACLTSRVLAVSGTARAIKPSGEIDGNPLHNFNQIFNGTDLQSSCLHPSDKGNRYLADRVIEKLEGF